MDRAAKKELVTTLNGVFKDTNVVVVAHYSGLNVAQMQSLRRQMKQAGAAVKVNNLALLPHKLSALLGDPSRLARLKRNARRAGRPRAAFEVARRALEWEKAAAGRG